MATLHKQSCPTCGQSVNEREIGLYKGMVTVLWDIYNWCMENNTHEFTRKDIKHLLKHDNEIARFGDWVFFGGLVYKIAKGHYGINMERVSAFFSGELSIPTLIIKNPLTKEIRKEQYRTVHEIPSLRDFMADNEFVSVYKEPTQVELV